MSRLFPALSGDLGAQDAASHPVSDDPSPESCEYRSFLALTFMVSIQCAGHARLHKGEAGGYFKCCQSLSWE